MFEEERIATGKGIFNVKDAIKKTTMLPNIVLDAEEAQKFFEGVWDLTTIKGIAQMMPMKSQKKNLRHLGLTERIMHPEDTMDSTKIVTTLLENKIQLSTVESRAAVLIKDADLEDMNIGSAAEYKTAVMRIIQNKLANEIEEAAWIGDANSLTGFGNDDIRGRKDGWRYQLEHSQSGETYENTVTGSATIIDASGTVTDDAASYSITTTQGPVEFDSSAPYHPEFKLDAFMDLMPVQYLALSGDFKFIMHNRIWRKQLAGERKLGTEVAHMSLRNPVGFDQFDGVPVVPFYQMPLTMKIDTVDAQKEVFTASSGTTATGGDLTDVILTPANNLVYGVQLDLMMEIERSAANRGNNFWFTVRDDAKIRNVDAAMFGKRFKNA